MTERVWAEISLNALKANYHAIKALAAPSELIPVVKSNAYGHGAVDVVLALEQEGASRFAVATPAEAMELRRAGAKSDILILGYVSPNDAREMLENNVTLTLLSAEHAAALSAAVSGLGKRLKIHVAIDTGMSRLGFETEAPSFERSVAAICALAERPELETEGIFTHFATSEVPGDPFAAEQQSRFNAMLNALESHGLRFPIIHMSNSGAILNIPGARYNAVRPGIILYGVYPDNGLEDRLPLQRVMSLRTILVQVHEFSDPITVSYGRHYRSDGPIRTGTVSIGYADGLHRALSGKIDMLIRGRRAPQIGNICMDMCMIDLSEIPEARPGDIVTVFGADGEEHTGVEELADIAGTIPYELTCALSRRVGHRTK